MHPNLRAMNRDVGVDVPKDGLLNWTIKDTAFFKWCIGNSSTEPPSVGQYIISFQILEVLHYFTTQIFWCWGTTSKDFSCVAEISVRMISWKEPQTRSAAVVSIPLWNEQKKHLLNIYLLLRMIWIVLQSRSYGYTFTKSCVLQAEQIIINYPSILFRTECRTAR